MDGFDEVFDWVVVGNGGGSMSSALVMREAGKSVVILEKTSWAGGSVPSATAFMKAGGDTMSRPVAFAM